MATTAKRAKAPIRNLSDEQAVANGCYFEEAPAKRVRKFCADFLCHSKGQWAGKPFKLLDWQYDDIIRPLFGWRRANGTRRFRRAYCELPKKNGKSTLCAAVGLYLLLGDNEPGAEVYSAAADKDQASIVHGEAIRMVEASPELSSVLDINHTNRNILHRAAQSYYRVLSSEAASQEGLNASGIIIDELHIWRGRALWDALRYAGRARRQPLTFAISTAGSDVTSVCFEQHEHARAVLSGETIDERLFAYIRAAEEADPLDDPETWRKANPAMGTLIDEADFAADLDEARTSASALSSFKRYSLNVWATSENPALRPEDWQKCARDFTEDSLRGRDCFGGLDLARTSDLTSFCLIFPDCDDTYAVLPYYWLPKATAEDRHHPHADRYYDWAARGLIELTDGEVCDYGFVRKRIAELSEKFNIRGFAYDPWQAEETTQAIESELGIKRVSFQQTLKNFAAPSAELERLVIAGRFNHNAHAVLTAQAGWLHWHTDANGNKRPVKPKPGDPRTIDGMVASIMGLAQAKADDSGDYLTEILWAN